MNALLGLTLLLLAQPGDEVRLRKLDKDFVEVIAPLSSAHDKIPQGRLSADLGEAWLRLCVFDPKTEKPGRPMLGSYERRGDDLLFRPRFALEPDRLYRATFGPLSDPVATADYRVAKAQSKDPPRIVKIYPGADVLPANHLRFYIYFSRPMRGGKEIFQQIEILGPDGKAIEDPWLIEEIWDENDQCLILYIHPGRIKWGVLLRELLGPVLVPGREYSLVVRGDMLDADGQKIGKDHVKKFRTADEDRSRIALAGWKIRAPETGSRQPVAVHFEKSIDHHSLTRFLRITDEKGTNVAGSFQLGAEERSWSFVPAAPWQDREYRLSVNGRLEDVAGNTPQRPFDLDLRAKSPAPQPLDLPFRPRVAN